MLPLHVCSVFVGPCGFCVRGNSLQFTYPHFVTMEQLQELLNLVGPHSHALMTFRSWSTVAPPRSALGLQLGLNPGIQAAQHPLPLHMRHRVPRVNLGTLNTRTLRCRTLVQADGTVETAGVEKLEMLKRRVEEHSLYLLALQEIRLTGSGSLDVGDGFTLVFGGNINTPGQGGTGVLLSPAASRAWRQAGERTITYPSGRVLAVSLKLGASEGLFHVLSVYGPALQQDASEKRQFWQDLSSCYDRFPGRELCFLLGGFNCRLGQGPFGAVLGPYGLGSRASNGDDFLAWASARNLRVRNTYRHHPNDHFATWRNHRYGMPALLDIAVGRVSDSRHVLDAHAIPGCEVDSDHRLVILKLRACPGPCRNAQATAPISHEAPALAKRLPRLNVALLRQPAMAEAYVAAVQASLPAPAATFVELSTALRAAGEKVLGTASCPGDGLDWRKGREDELRASSHRRQTALDAARRAGWTPATVTALRLARHAARDLVRKLQNEAWTARMTLLESAARGGNAKHVFSDVRALGRVVGLKGSLRRAPCPAQDQSGHALPSYPECPWRVC